MGGKVLYGGGLTLPVAAVGGAEEEVLEDDRNEVPEDDLTTEHGLVEGSNLSRRLTVIVGQTKCQEQANSEKGGGNGVADGTAKGSVS